MSLLQIHLLLALAGSSGVVTPQSNGPRAPSAVVIVLDDIGAKDLAGLETPAIASLARRGLTFTRAYGMPICHPARRTLLSGEVWPNRYASNPCDPGPLPGPRVGDLPLPALFRDAGYATAGFGKWHLGAHPEDQPWPLAPFAHGFDVWRAGVPANVELCGGRNYRLWTRMEDGESFPYGGYQTQELTRAFVHWWSAARGPKLAWVAFQTAHEPFHRPPDELLPAGYPATPDARSKYEAMIVSADTALGEMLAHIDLKQTYVVLVADNGTPEPVAPDPARAKNTTFERGIRVPMLIAGPGVRPGVSGSLVHLADVFDTLRELCALDRAQPARDSVSLVPCLTDPTFRPREYVFVQLEDDLAVVSAHHKLREKAGVQAFYDLWLDPLEERPIPLDDADLALSIARHRAWLELERRQAFVAHTPGAPAQSGR